MSLRKKNKLMGSKLELNLIIWQIVSYVSIFNTANNIYWILPFIASLIISMNLSRIYQERLLAKEVMSLLQMEEE